MCPGGVRSACEPGAWWSGEVALLSHHRPSLMWLQMGYLVYSAVNTVQQRKHLCQWRLLW